jgi:hypothetical protein
MHQSLHNAHTVIVTSYWYTVYQLYVYFFDLVE